jgi:hypothetical protein
MRKLWISLMLGLYVLALGWSVPVTATTVYKSVDESGVVSFSDALPETGSAVETLELNGANVTPSANQQQRLEDMRETTDRMASDRMAREKHRAEIKKIQAEADALQKEQTPQYVEYPQYAYPYRPAYYAPIKRPRPVPYRNDVDHSTITPPLRSSRNNHVSTQQRFVPAKMGPR